MATEIERKFLLKNNHWRDSVEMTITMRQGYMIGSAKASVRIRVADQLANINIKSATLGISRQEYEYAIDVSDANEMLDALCDKPLIEKHRHIVSIGEHKWEIDEFYGDNSGLIVAEIELTDVAETFQIPDWLGQEVSSEAKYYNVCLVKTPYKDW